MGHPMFIQSSRDLRGSSAKLQKQLKSGRLAGPKAVSPKPK